MSPKKTFFLFLCPTGQFVFPSYGMRPYMKEGISYEDWSSNRNTLNYFYKYMNLPVVLKKSLLSPAGTSLVNLVILLFGPE